MGQKREGWRCLLQPKALSYDLHPRGLLSVLPIEKSLATGHRTSKNNIWFF